MAKTFTNIYFLIYNKKLYVVGDNSFLNQKDVPMMRTSLH